MARRGGQLEERECVQVKGKKEWAREGVFASNKDIPPLLPTVDSIIELASLPFPSRGNCDREVRQEERRGSLLQSGEGGRV